MKFHSFCVFLISLTICNLAYSAEKAVIRKLFDKTVFIVRLELSWADALAYCENLSATLLSIRSKAENDEVVQLSHLIPNGLGNHVWLGGYNYQEDRVWRWTGDGSRVTYSNWEKGQPNNLNNKEYCLHMYSWHDWASLVGKWNDWKCVDKKYFMCEIPEKR